MGDEATLYYQILRISSLAPNIPTASHNTPAEDSSAFYSFGRLQRLGTGSRLPQRESRSCSASLLVSRAAWSYPGVLGSLGRANRKSEVLGLDLMSGKLPDLAGRFQGRSSPVSGSERYFNLTYSDLAAMRMGMSGSASFHRARKS